MLLELSELEQDALVEVFNLGIGYAADSLSRIVGDQVRMSVPSLTIVPHGELAKTGREAGLARERLCGVVQRFEGDLRAQALLMFPEERSLELVRVMVGDGVLVEEMDDLEQEALTEVGNIILNSCLSVISDTLGSVFTTSLPEFVTGDVAHMLPEAKDEDELILLLNIDFLVERREIRGYLLFVMQMASLVRFRDAIKSYLAPYL